MEEKKKIMFRLELLKICSFSFTFLFSHTLHPPKHTFHLFVYSWSKLKISSEQESQQVPT